MGAEQLQTDVQIVLRDGTNPSTRTLHNPALGPWVRKLRGLTCPTAAGPSYILPCNYPASISHSGSKGRSRAKPRVPQSLASHIPNCWCSWGKDRKHPAHSSPGPFLVTCTTVLPALQDGWDMDTGAPPTGAQPGWAEF